MLSGIEVPTTWPSMASAWSRTAPASARTCRPPHRHGDVAYPKATGLWEKAGPRNLARWRMMHSGPLTTDVAEAGGFSRTDPSLPAPDLQWHALPTPYQNFGLTDPSIRALSLLITLVAVGSRGRITLRSADPRHKPAIDPAYLSDSADIEPLVRGIRLAREFAAAGPLAKICKGELAPGPDAVTDSELTEFVRRDITTIYHPVGTCAMGGDSRLAASKLTSVVDTGLRVRGVDGLRVVDASVMPAIVSGNTSADHRDRRAGGRPDQRPRARRHGAASSLPVCRL
jgi:choline dehydrogenase